jgi:PAP2 superfamily
MGADQAVPVLAWVPWTDGGYHLVEALAGSGRRARCICGRRGLVEAAILVLVLVAFAGLHAVVAQDAAAAAAHAHAVQSLERGLHLDIELTTNRWLAEHEAFIAPAVLLYRLYYAVLLGVLIWVFFGHPDIYLRARRTFVAMTGLALLVFWVLPTSPPRFALPGVVDIIAEHDILATHAGPAAKSSVDLTAMPSLHVGGPPGAHMSCGVLVVRLTRGLRRSRGCFPWPWPQTCSAPGITTSSMLVAALCCWPRRSRWRLGGLGWWIGGPARP